MKPAVIVPIVLSIAIGSARAAATSGPGQKVQDLFEAKCAECHHKSSGESEDPALHKNVDLEALRTNRDYVIAGDAAKSPLYQRLVKEPGSKERMPKSKGKEGDKTYRPPLTSEEVEVVKTWIEGKPAGDKGAQVAVEGARPFAEDAQVEIDILKDFERGTIPPGDRRYLSLANCYNARDAAGNPLFDADRMTRAKAAVDKLLNSLSYNPEIKLSQVVDNQGILLRLRLSDYGWSAETWEQVSNVYPFAVQTSELGEARRITGSKQAWMRADWFVFAVSQPPLYNKFLHLPGDTGAENAVVQLESKLGIRYESKVKEAATVRSGFERSGVSQGNRIIERIALPDGAYYWKSYDFNKDRKNELGGDIFQSPLGPVDGGLSQNRERIFSQDGGELIFSLPNGLQGYMLANGRGNRLDQAPKEVVRDSSRKDGLIINGISCMSCHKDGLLVPASSDEISPHSKSLALAAGDRAEIERLYNQDKVVQALKEDQERFVKAMEHFAMPGTSDPVRDIYDAFRQDIAVQNISAEIGRDVPVDEIAAKMEQSDDQRTRDAAASIRQKQHALPRITMIQIFPVLVAQLDLGKPRPADALVYEEFGARPVEQRTKAEDNANGGAPRVKNETTRPKAIVVGPSSSDSNYAGGDVGIRVRPSKAEPEATRPPPIKVDQEASAKTAPPPRTGGEGAPSVIRVGQGQESYIVTPRGSSQPIRVGPPKNEDGAGSSQNQGVAAFKTVETPPEPAPQPPVTR